MDTLFAGYAARERTFDEMFEAAPNEVRSGYADVHHRLTRMSPADVRGRADFLARIYVEQGVTFVGRLAEYRYYNMDQVVAAALAAAQRLLN